MSGLLAAGKNYGANDAFPIEDIDDSPLPGSMEKRNKVFYSVGNNQDFDNQVISWVNSLRAKVRNGVQAPHEFISLDVLLHEMRLFKFPQEQELMRGAAKVAVSAHQRAMKTCRPGMMEYEIDAENTVSEIRGRFRLYQHRWWWRKMPVFFTISITT